MNEELRDIASKIWAKHDRKKLRKYLFENKEYFWVMIPGIFTMLLSVWNLKKQDIEW